MDELATQVEFFLERAHRTSAESIELDACLGRYLAQDVYAQHPWPPFHRALRDGYAVASTGVIEAFKERDFVQLRLEGTVPAGSVSSFYLQGVQAVRIFTGAKLPEGADSVVPFEDITEDGMRVFLTRPVSPWQYVQRKGDLREKGECLFPRGIQLTPGEIGVLASTGFGSVEVQKPPRVAIFPVGSELVEPGKDLGDGKIYSSNGYLLGAWTRIWGGEPIRHKALADDLFQIAETVQIALLNSEIVITTGGASHGDYDLAPAVLEALGSEEMVRIEPKSAGGPFVGGIVQGKIVLCFSGSPKAAVRSAKLFLKPLLARMLGARVQ